MTNFFYTDASGQRLGPYSDGQLKAFAAQGFITPQTVLETEAGQIPGLFDSLPLNQPAQNLYQQSAQYQTTNEENPKATVGKILGWIAILVWTVPLAGFPVSITGLVFSVKGDTGLGKTLNIIGLILTIISAIIGMLLSMITLGATIPFEIGHF